MRGALRAIAFVWGFVLVVGGALAAMYGPAFILKDQVGGWAAGVYLALLFTAQVAILGWAHERSD